MKNRLIYTFAFFFTTILISCSGSKNVSVSQRILDLKDVLKRENTYIENLDKTRIAKYDEKAIDDTTSIRLRKKLNAYMEKNNGILKELENIQASIKKNKNSDPAFENKVKISLDEIERNINNKKVIAARKKNLELINATLTSAKLNQFEFAAFFGPGVHQLTVQDIPLVEKTFGKLVDSLVIFSNRFSSIPREAIISIYGYADGQAINIDSDLSAKLQKLSGVKTNSSTSLNKLLSLQRAKEMNKIIEGIMQKKSSMFSKPETLKTTQYLQGMGETFPNPKIKDYKTDDERRRIVVFYWSVVPI